MSKQAKSKHEPAGLRILRFIGQLFATCIMVGVITGCIVACVLTVYILNMIGSDEQIDLDVERLGYSSTIVAFDKDGGEVELQKLYLPDNNRIWVDYADISEHVKEAVVAIEDKRFWKHQGVDWRRTFGAFLDMFAPGTAIGGGSTITQQLIKNITEDDDVRVDRKVREIFRAIKLENDYTKDQILEAYLNVVPFGAGTNGIESAAQTYFGKSASELDLAEAACIVGITKYPTKYNPRIYPENNKDRQEHVLWEMWDQGMITDTQYEAARVQELNILSVEVQQQEQAMTTYFEDHVINTVLADLQEHNDWTYSYAFQQLYKGGYTIYATVDIEMQEYLEALYVDLSNFPAVYNAEYPQSASVITDHNGKILALVGSNRPKEGALTFNRATRATRQPGSSLKPLGPYALAFENNRVTWSTIIDDNAIQLATGPWPTNYYNSYLGPVTVAYAIQRSVNTVPAKLVQAMGPETVFNFLHDRLNMYNLVASGVSDGYRYSDIDLAPMALGALTRGVTPLEMVGGYQIYANGGYFTTPYCYTKVVDSNGRIILEVDTTANRVISEDTSVLVNKALQSVTTASAGTGTDARLTNFATAGKTGTSEHDINQWFIGMSPYYVCGVWMGYDEETYINQYGNVAYNTILYGRYPPPIMFKTIMDPLHEGLEAKSFRESDEVVSRTYCAQTGLLAGTNCSSTASGWYKTSVPVATCPGHTVARGNADGDGDTDGGGGATSRISGNTANRDTDTTPRWAQDN